MYSGVSETKAMLHWALARGFGFLPNGRTYMLSVDKSARFQAAANRMFSINLDDFPELVVEPSKPSVKPSP